MADHTEAGRRPLKVRYTLTAMKRALLLLLLGCSAPPPPPPPAPRSNRFSTIPAGAEVEKITFSADGSSVAWLSRARKNDAVVLNGHETPTGGYV